MRISDWSSDVCSSDLKEKGKVLATGAAIGSAIASGRPCVIRSAAEIADFQDGAVLVTEATDPDWVPIMNRAAGIVTDHGGTTSHAAILSRAPGVGALVSTGDASSGIGEGHGTPDEGRGG